jgi:hypothetical protein
MEGTFVQLSGEQIEWTRRDWRPVLADLRELGISTIVLQHSGDPHGSYESYDRRPITSLLQEADTHEGMSVWIGLAHMPGWPQTTPDQFAPLADPRAVEQLGRMCEEHRSCAGFYLSPEIEDLTWSLSEERVLHVRRLLEDAITTLRTRVPRARFAISPYFSGELPPDEYAAWLARVIDGLGVDVVMLQGGTGTRRFTADDARRYYVALAQALPQTELWLVVELFHQTAGPPVNDRPYAARPASPRDVERAMLRDVPEVRHRIGYTVLDYMNGRRGGARLRASYLRSCRR